MLHLRVREGEPYLLHLVLVEEAVYNLDIGAQESHVLQPFVQSLLGSRPHARALDVHAYEVDVGIFAGQPYGIFTASAAQFEHYRVGVVEVHVAPMPLHLKRHVVYDRERILKHVLKRFHIRKFG